MCCSYHTSNTINLVTATKYTAFLGHRILRLPERSHRLQRDDARGHFRQIRRSDYEAARSICCWTSCSPFQIVGREPPDLGLILRPFGSIQATAVQPLLTASQGERTDKRSSVAWPLLPLHRAEPSRARR